jgi:hypothetical protein
MALVFYRVGTLVLFCNDGFYSRSVDWPARRFYCGCSGLKKVNTCEDLHGKYMLPGTALPISPITWYNPMQGSSSKSERKGDVKFAK